MNSKTKKILIASGATILLIMLTTNETDAAESIIKDLEVGAGGDPYLEAVPDTNGFWQIGYGSTYNYLKDRFVIKGDTITKEQANELLKKEVQAKRDLINKVVKVPLSKNQLNALISFVYNIGAGAFQTSTLLRLLNSGADKKTVADQFDRWIYAEGRTLPGLINRRAQEKQLFLS